jgi:sRNA-binding regulator protein Hfq
MAKKERTAVEICGVNGKFKIKTEAKSLDIEEVEFIINEISNMMFKRAIDMMVKNNNASKTELMIHKTMGIISFGISLILLFLLLK